MYTIINLNKCKKLPLNRKLPLNSESTAIIVQLSNININVRILNNVC